MSLYVWADESGWERIGYLDEAKASGRPYHEAGARAHSRSLTRTRGWSEEKGLGTGTLTERERRSLEMQLGVPIQDAQHARAVMKAKGVRFEEKGEASYEEGNAMVQGREWGGRSPLSGPRREFHFDHAAELQRQVAIYKERGGVLTDD